MKKKYERIFLKHIKVKLIEVDSNNKRKYSGKPMRRTIRKGVSL